jgi:hypothetical protein
VRNELAAMRAIATALESLPDNRARSRVMRWAIDVLELFVTDARSVSEPDTAENQVEEIAPPPSSDPSLDVDGIDELFDQAPTARARVDQSLQAAEPLSPQTRMREGGSERPQKRSAPDSLNVTSMIHGFVTDFQDLARDWRERLDAESNR